MLSLFKEVYPGARYPKNMIFHSENRSTAGDITKACEMLRTGPFSRAGA